MAKSLRAKHPEENLHILVAKRNSGSFTYDGIELGGERVCQEIEEEVEKLARAGQEIKRFSLVGYSLGGLVSRYAVGLLDSKGFFEKIKPVVSSAAANTVSQIANRMIRTSQPLRLLISAYEHP
jgi:triacylglycerol esterase/lipase EstA (alpha/beta hydrolase family)